MKDLTKAQFKRTELDFKKYAKSETVKVSFEDGQFLVLCEEVEMYRIANTYNFNKEKISFGFSENLNSWYLILKINGFYGKY